MTYLLFDLGHVLVDLNGMPWLRRHWSGCDDAEVHRRWLGLGPVQKYERGRIGSDEFFSRMPMALGTDLTPEEFEAIFDGWLVGAYAGAEAFLQSLRGKYRLGCLSNTNRSHITKLRTESSLLDTFDDCFLSYEINCMKPTPSAYTCVLEAVGIPAEEFWFFDDNATNIAAAAELGMRTTQVCGLDALMAALPQGASSASE